MKPIMYLIRSFDSNVETTIKFSWLGNLPISNTLRIRDNITNEIVYEKTQTTMRLEHTISSNNNLINGRLYNASISVTDSNNSISEWSDVQLFYCFTTPTLSINIDQGQVIQAQTYGVEITYGQSEGELLQSYRAIVYSANNEVIYDSNIRYILDTIKITNLQDNGDYSIVVTGTTINGMNVSTERISFSVDFIKSEAYFVCELENMYNTGGIYIKSNIISVEGYSDKEVVYIDKDIADLTNNVVHFDSGFSINNNFALAIKGDMNVDSHILKLSGNDEQINVYLKHDNSFKQNYFELEALYKNNRYIITTIAPTITKYISLWIKRINGLFQMEVV
jgi:hypothetical protein